MRPLHCTQLGLTTAISPNVGKSGAQFLVVGVCVRAAPEEKMEIIENVCSVRERERERDIFSFLLDHQLFFVPSSSSECCAECCMGYRSNKSIYPPPVFFPVANASYYYYYSFIPRWRDANKDD